MRSVHLASDKSLFDVTAIDAAALSASMGLPGTPKIKFTSGLLEMTVYCGVLNVVYCVFMQV